MMIRHKSSINFFTIILVTLNLDLFSQSALNPTPIKKILFESGNRNYLQINSLNKFNITYNQFFYNNSNLSNFENLNGIHIPKGYGSFSGLLFKYEGKNIFLTVEPRINIKKYFLGDAPEKSGIFSVSNDQDNYRINDNTPRNIGIKYKIKNFNIGYGNWDQWWGPGIHNSLTLSNNARGFYHYDLNYINEYPVGFNNIKIKLNYTLSNPFKNSFGAEFFLSSGKALLSYKKIEIGISRDFLSGGYRDLKWDINDAAFLIFTNNNSQYWNQTNSFYIKYSSKDTGLNIFYELGAPKMGFNDKKISNYSDHGYGTNIGLRKYGGFGFKDLIFGFEYTRLLQSPYYNILPSPNWYDDIKFNYSSYINRRWGAHSGPDSDDLLVYIGSIGNSLGLIYAINYERHGVTYNFPPEVKLESKIMLSFKIKRLFLSLELENEYFEHYGFVDTNLNVWNQTYESGSIQRTNSVLFSIENRLF